MCWPVAMLCFHYFVTMVTQPKGSKHKTGLQLCVLFGMKQHKMVTSIPCVLLRFSLGSQL